VSQSTTERSSNEERIAEKILRAALVRIKNPARKEINNMAKRKKVEHFWISNELADQFISWCRNQSELEEMDPMTAEFTPERARFKYTDQKFGFTQTFMLYNKEKYNCVNVPQNARAALSTFAADSGLELPSGKLGQARGDGRDDATLATERAAKAEEKAKAKTAKAKERKSKAKTTKAKAKTTRKPGGKSAAKA
jgi:hypothetical protein